MARNGKIGYIAADTSWNKWPGLIWLEQVKLAPIFEQFEKSMAQTFEQQGLTYAFATRLSNTDAGALWFSHTYGEWLRANVGKHNDSWKIVANMLTANNEIYTFSFALHVRDPAHAALFKLTFG